MSISIAVITVNVDFFVQYQVFSICCSFIFLFADILLNFFHIFSGNFIIVIVSIIIYQLYNFLSAAVMFYDLHCISSCILVLHVKPNSF